jgi:hypothetical protein
VASSTVTFIPGWAAPVNSSEALIEPQALLNPELVVFESSPPMVWKLSYANSGKAGNNNGLMPDAFQDALKALLYHCPHEEFKIMGKFESPAHADI